MRLMIKKDPDMTAYSFAYGYEIYRLLEIGLMVDYTTVADKSIFSLCFTIFVIFENLFHKM